MKYLELEEYLFSIRDEKFAKFSKSLSNSDYISLGVKNPIIKKLVKECVNDKELNIYDFKLGIYLEIDLFYFCLALARLKTSEEQLDFLLDNIKYAKSWVITDCLSSFLKNITYEQFYNFFIKTYSSNYTFEKRMAYVLALKQCKNKEIFNILSLIRHNEEYMVMMAEAWLLSTIAITYEDEVYFYLKECSDVVLKRKTISKICDSYRFNDESKNRFKELRKNIKN